MIGLAALTMLLSLGTASAAPGGESVPGAAAAVAPEADGSPGNPSGQKPEEKPTVGRVAGNAALGILGVGLLEGLFIATSEGLAGSPDGGWLLIALSPIAAGSGSAENAAAGLTFAGGVVGLSLYNVIELRKSHYTHRQRFQRNLVGFHVALALGVGAQVLFGPGAPGKDSRVAVGMGIGDEGPALLVGGRF